ncbi:MAG: ABC transporter permease [Ignavibacteriales bacterium]|nr:ABC transporter permease [Ignavibacteriales bacterium]
MNFSFQIANRYIRSKKGAKFLSLISVITIAGISLGIAVLIMAISILSGFDKTVSENIIKFNAHINISGFSSKNLPNYDSNYKIIENALRGKYSSISPYISQKVLITKTDFTDGILLTGIDSGYAEQSLKKILVKGNLNLNSNEFNVIIGKKLAVNLKVMVGDFINVISMRNDEIPSLSNFPTIEQFKITGIYESGMAEYDDIYAYVNFETAKSIFEIKNEVSGFNINVKNISEIDSLKDKLQSILPYPYYTRGYREINKHIFTWLELQQKPIPIVLGLIIIVAIFNIVGALLMLIIQKTEAIGVLKSIGANRKQIIQIFVFQGLFLAGVGIILGNFLAFILSWIQNTYKIISLPSQIYYLSSVPIFIDVKVYILISLLGIILAFLASLIPSFIASRIQPIKAIKFN